MAYTIPGVGGPNWNTSQVGLTVSSSTLLSARPTRSYVVLRNLDATNSGYISSATPATAANGTILKAGESRAFYHTAIMYAIAAAGTPIIEIEEVWY